MIVLNVCILYTMIDIKMNLYSKIKEYSNSAVKSLNISKTIDNSIKNKIDSLNLHDGYTPILGKDYFNGANGTNGVNGLNGKDGLSIKGDTGEPGKDAPIGVLVCNTKKDRWEITYNNGVSYSIIMSKDGLSTVKCVIN